MPGCSNSIPSEPLASSAYLPKLHSRTVTAPSNDRQKYMINGCGRWTFLASVGRPRHLLTTALPTITATGWPRLSSCCRFSASAKPTSGCLSSLGVADNIPNIHISELTLLLTAQRKVFLAYSWHRRCIVEQVSHNETLQIAHKQGHILLDMYRI